MTLTFTQQLNNREIEKVTTNTKYKAKSLQDIIDNPADKPDEILERGILVKSAKACIYAKEKVGKSLLAVQLGLCLASGNSFLGIKVVNKCKVLYLNFELNEYALEQRVLDIRNKLGLDNVPGFRALTLLGDNTPLLDTSEGQKIVSDLLTFQEQDGLAPDVLIWDCRYKTFESSENQDDNMKKWCLNMEELALVSRFTPVIIHHEGKDTQGVGAGSSVFDRWINTGIRIRPHLWDAPFKPSKERQILVGGNYTSGEIINTVLDYPIHRLGGNEVWKKTLTKKDKATTYILEELTDGAVEQSELEKQAKAQGIKRSTFLSTLEHLELIRQVKSSPVPNKQGRHNLLELVSEAEEDIPVAS